MHRRWARAIALGALVAVASAAGCTPADEPDPTPAPEATGVETPTPTPEARPDPDAHEAEPAARAPLTGRGVDDPDALERPVIAVKIDDAAGALPQEGLAASDIVFTELVEGGTARFLALFHEEAPGEVGPVRSARSSDGDLLPSVRGLLVVSGAAPQVLAELRSAEVSLVEEGQPGQAWRREPARIAPHNLFVRVDALWEMVADLVEAGDLDPADPTLRAARPWPIAEQGQAMPRGAPAHGVRLAFSQAAQAAWRWDADEAVWQRLRDGEPHGDADGDPLVADNVVVARVATSVGARTDATGAGTVDSQLLGDGQAVVLRDGAAVEGRWERDAPSEPFRFLTVEGRAIEMAAGRTWVELVPSSGSVRVHYAEGD